MRIVAFLELAIAFERGLEGLYADLARQLEGERGLAEFFMQLAHEERSHACLAEWAMERCDPDADMILSGVHPPEAMLDMLADVRDEVRGSRLRPWDAWEILAHMETFAETEFYAQVTGVPEEPVGTVILHLKETCAGHAARILGRIAGR